MKTHSILISSIALTLLLALPASAEVLYNVTDLGTLKGGNSSSARSINNNGQIVGYSNDSTEPPWHWSATLFDPTGTDENMSLGEGRATAINDSGQIVGWVGLASSYGKALLFDSTGGGKNTELGALGGDCASAYSINNNGHIVGKAETASGEFRATLFDSTGAGANIDLGTPGGCCSCAYSINGSGQIVGYEHPDSTALVCATLFDSTGGGNNINLCPIGFDYSVAYSVNDSGQIIGEAGSMWFSSRATLFDPTGDGNNTDLGTLGGPYSHAYCINNNNQVVGTADTAPDESYATLFDPTGGGNNINLNNSIDPNLGWDLDVAFSINDNGWIIGNGRNPDGDRHAYLLTPVPTAIEAIVEIAPHTLNLQSKGKWITCYIWLPEDYDVADVNSYSVFLEDEIGAEWIWADEQEQVLMAKFSRSALQEMLAGWDELGEVELLITGELADGTKFEGTDTIKVIDKGKQK